MVKPYHLRTKFLSCFIIIFLFISRIPALCQNQAGDININVGLGYSPGFIDGLGFLGSSYYPAPIDTYIVNVINYDQEPVFFSTARVPCINFTTDYTVVSVLSLGIAAGYQSELMNWSLTGNAPYYTDRLTRLNFAGRLLFHLTRKSKKIDFYIGCRPGFCYWSDRSQNSLYIIGYGYLHFLENPNYSTFCLQTLAGMRCYGTKNFGFHFEFGLGQPYTAEAGITFRLATRKKAETAGPEALPGHTHH